VDHDMGADEGACRTAIAVARDLYGDLIELIVTYPETGRITVWLVGGAAEVIDADGTVRTPADIEAVFVVGPLVVIAVGAVLLGLGGITHTDILVWVAGAVMAVGVVLRFVSLYHTSRRR